MSTERKYPRVRIHLNSAQLITREAGGLSVNSKPRNIFPKETVAQKVARNTYELYQRETGETNLPIDPLKVAQFCGVNTMSGVMSKDIVGLISCQNGYTPTIYLNLHHKMKDILFACARELGRYLYHAEGNPHDYYGYTYTEALHNSAIAPGLLNKDNKEEVFATQFAAALLIPTDIVLNDYDYVEENKLRKSFGVGKKVWQYRLIGLGIQ